MENTDFVKNKACVTCADVGDDVVDVGRTRAESVGVCFDRSRNKFKAYVDIFGVRVRLGSAFATAQEAKEARDAFISRIYDSSYGPLPSFLCDRFGLSMNRAYAAIVLCVPLYLGLPTPQHSMFPNFVVASVLNKTVDVRGLSDSEVEDAVFLLKSLPPFASAVALGRLSFSQARAKFGCRYEDISEAFYDCARSIRKPLA